MDDVAAKDDIVPFLVEGHGLRLSIDLERYAQRAVDENRDGRGIAVCFGAVGTPFTVRVHSPFYLDVGLVPQPQFSRNELTNEPTGAPDLINGCVPEIERRVPAHARLLPTPADGNAKLPNSGLKRVHTRI